MQGPVLQAFLFDELTPKAPGQHRGISIGAGRRHAGARTGGCHDHLRGHGSQRRKDPVAADGPGRLSVTLLHLGSFSVGQGAVVAEGQQVGTVSSSGSCRDQRAVRLPRRSASRGPAGLPRPAALPAAACRRAAARRTADARPATGARRPADTRRAAAGRGAPRPARGAATASAVRDSAIDGSGAPGELRPSSRPLRPRRRRRPRRSLARALSTPPRATRASPPTCRPVRSRRLLARPCRPSARFARHSRSAVSRSGAREIPWVRPLDPVAAPASTGLELSRSFRGDRASGGRAPGDARRGRAAAADRAPRPRQGRSYH